MKASYTILTETGRDARVEFSVVKDDIAEKPFGIFATYISGDDSDEAYAKHRFFTQEEAIRTIEYLCQHKVTPCTLLDII